MVTTQIEVMLQVRQMFDSLVNIDALRTEVKEEEQKAREIKQQNAAALQAMVAAQTVTMMTMIEITLTETGTETFNVDLRWTCLACVSLGFNAKFCS